MAIRNSTSRARETRWPRRQTRSEFVRDAATHSQSPLPAQLPRKWWVGKAKARGPKAKPACDVRSSNSTSRGWLGRTGLRGRTSVGSHRSGRLCRQLPEDGSSGQATFVECTTMPSTVAICIVNFMPCLLKSDPTCHNCCAMVAGSCLMHITQSACQANASAFY